VGAAEILLGAACDGLAAVLLGAACDGLAAVLPWAGRAVVLEAQGSNPGGFARPMLSPPNCAPSSADEFFS
jgi:hypothetical protein